MLENILKNFLIYLIVGLVFLSLFFLIFIFYLLKKRKKNETSQNYLKNLPSDAILLKISEDFRKETENLIRIQIERSYRELISSIFPEIKNSVLINAEKFGKQLGLLMESAEKDVSRFREMTETIYKDLINENKKNIERVSQSFLLEAKEKLNSLSTKLEKETMQIFQEAKLDISKKIIEAERFIEERKKEQIEEIEKNIYKILNDVAKKTLAKTIDFSTHEDLIMKALEKAKKENFFKL